ncbi:MAG: phosphomethylpyrimidine synthase ThiC [Candidatus Omnitrophica bacterium]|nr:phosphomethylpyrimidine synthase ThiC [Candidatus Omnitrophota bacterium]
MTQIDQAKTNRITQEVRYIAKLEKIPSKLLSKRIASNEAVIFSNNIRRPKKTTAVGKGLKTKVNVNIGSSTDKANVKLELKKLREAVNLGADTIMDLSVGPDAQRVRNLILKNSPIPVGTVPIYEAALLARKKRGSFLKMDLETMLKCIENQAKEGVDFFTIHSGITREGLKILKKSKRQIKIASRGGAILSAWMDANKKENPLYEHFDEILKIAYKYDIVLSLGDALRPGAISDATDAAQINELRHLADLVKKARRKNVQVIVEGPGHVPLHQIESNIVLQKKLCKNAPFYVLGPLVCDVAAGYDHITAAIGGALAAMYGADFLCYVTPAEHLRLPTISDMREGLIASRIAAHSADIAKGIKQADKWDRQVSSARNKRDWKKLISLSIDPQRASEFRHSIKARELKTCSMCGDYCSMKLTEASLPS